MNKKFLIVIIALITALISHQRNSFALSFQGLSSGITVSYEIDLPPGYDSANNYAVIYFLHGVNQSADSAKNNGKIKSSLDEAMVLGLIEPSILVYADGDLDSLYANSFDFSRPIETSIIEDLIPFIDANYPTKGVDFRAIMGFSMGGYGAIELFSKFPEKFDSVVSLDGAIHNWDSLVDSRANIAASMFNNQESNFTPYSIWHNTALNAANLNGKIRQVVGAVQALNSNFDEYLNSLNIVHEFEQTFFTNNVGNIVECNHSPACVLDNEARSSFAFVGEHFKRFEDCSSTYSIEGKLDIPCVIVLDGNGNNLMYQAVMQKTNDSSQFIFQLEEAQQLDKATFDTNNCIAAYSTAGLLNLPCVYVNDGLGNDTLFQAELLEAQGSTPFVFNLLQVEQK